MAQKKAQPTQTLTGPEEVIQTVQNMPEGTAENVVSLSQQKGKRSNRFETVDVAITEAAANKVSLIKEAREAFHEAAELASKGDENEGKAVASAQRGGVLLYRGRVSGILTPDEVSSILGDEFGWKGKGTKSGQRVTSAEPDATRSATPFGIGEMTRKRVVRAVGAQQFCVGNEQAAGAFFKGLEPETVQPLLNEVSNGGSLWTLYDKLAAAKREATGQRPKLAFDPKRISGIVSDLGANIADTVSRMQSNPALFNSYLGLYRMLGTIGREMPDDEASAA